MNNKNKINNISEEDKEDKVNKITTNINKLSYSKDILEYTLENSIENIYIKLFPNISCVLAKIQGNRVSMEDHFIIDIIDNIKILGVFDGHGGKDISFNIHTQLDQINKLIIKFNKGDISKDILILKLENEYIKLDKYFYNKYRKKQGSTAHIVYISNSFIIFINLGDSKGIYLDSKFNILIQTELHRPENLLEKERIYRNNCEVINNSGIYRINNELSLSRSFGDYKYKFIKEKYDGKNSSIISIPDIYFSDIVLNSYILIATDGLWDYIKNEEIIKIIKSISSENLNLIVKKIIMKSIDNGSNDNITAILLKII